MKRSRPTRLSDLMDQALARLGLDRRLDDYRVWQAWDEVVGRTISRNAQPVRLDGSRLVVAVRSSTWLQELSLLQKELIFRINDWMKREVVRELFFVVGRIEPQARSTEPQASSMENQARSVETKSSGPHARAGASRIKPANAAPTADVLPPTDDLDPGAAAVFERLWKAARARRDDAG